MRVFAVFLSLVLVSTGASGQITLGFEGSVPGQSLSASPDPEGWRTSGGTVTIAPFGALAGPTSQFPAEGGQWAVLHSLGASGALSGGPGGPAPYPIAPGATASIRTTLRIPFAVSGQQVTLSLAYLFVTPECFQAGTYNDWCSVDLVDPGTGLSVLNVLYRDTWSPSLVAGAVSPNESGTVTGSGCPGGALEEGPVVGTVHGASVVIPSSLYGQTLSLEAHVGDGGDASFNSWMYLDDIRFQGGIAAPAPMTSAITDLPSGQHLLTVDAPAVTVFGVPYELYNLVSQTPAAPTGSGSFLGLNFDNLTAWIVASPLGAAPFHVAMPSSPFTFGPFDLPPGLTIDWVTVAIRWVPLPMVVEVTPAQTKTF